MIEIERATASYIHFFTKLTDDQVDGFRRLAVTNVRYRDPLMDERGIENVLNAMHGWFASLEEVHFDFRSSASSGQQAFFHWFMHFQIRKMPKHQWKIDGTSRVVFNNEGMVVEVQDYWDTAPLLRAFPVLGNVVGLIKKFL